MTALGLILVALAVLVLLAVLFGGANLPTTLDLDVVEVQTTTIGVFLLGCATGLVLLLGLVLMRLGMRRDWRRRRELKRARAVVARQESSGPGGQADDRQPNDRQPGNTSTA